MRFTTVFFGFIFRFFEHLVSVGLFFHKILKSFDHYSFILLQLHIFFISWACPVVAVVHLLSHVTLFATLWTAAHQVSLSFTVSRRWLKLMSIDLMMPSNYFILRHLLLLLPSVLPRIRIFSNESALASGSQSIGASASASVLPMNIQGWFPLRLTGLISLLPNGLSRVFSGPTIRRHQFFGTQPSLWSNSHIHTWLLENHSFDHTDLCQQRGVSVF